jgi:hypothetical protein
MRTMLTDGSQSTSTLCNRRYVVPTTRVVGREEKQYICTAAKDKYAATIK